MKALLTITCLALSLNVMAQKPEAIIQKVDVPPVIGGDIDPAWDAANVYIIDKPFLFESPTLPGGASWRALWDWKGIYLLTEVGDDVYYPWYAPDPDGTQLWKYDNPEIYFDVNLELEDEQGCTDGGANGHWQIAPKIIEGKTDGTVMEEDGYSWALTDNGDGSYYAEYFISLDMLTDEDGYIADLTRDVGFDVYIVDNDEDPEGNAQRAVWANDGQVNMAWANMDDCGILKFDGAELETYISNIILEDVVIDINNGQAQVQAIVEPADATKQVLEWTIENGTGRAVIDDQGVVTGIIDGTAIVTAEATDGSYVQGSCTVTISNQIVSLEELNLIRNANYDEVNDEGSPAEWNSYSANPDLTAPYVEDGVLIMHPVKDEANPQEWAYQHFQNGLQALPDVAYEFGFVAWADENSDLPVCFQDGPENNYHFYGISNSEWSDGRSNWHVPIGTEPAKYVMDVNFVDIVSNTDQSVKFWPGLLTMGVYLDSVYLVIPGDLDLLTDHIAVDSIKVSGASFVLLGSDQQMVSEVFPSGATLSSVKWSVIPGTGLASIDQSGLLTAEAIGTVTVVCSAMDDSKASGALEVTINECEDIVEVDVDIWNESCPGTKNGSILLVLSEDTANFSYEWSNGETSAFNHSLEPGDYDVRIIDRKGCPRNRTYTVLPAVPMATKFVASAPSCYHLSDGELTVEVSGGVEPYTILWGNGSDAETLTGLSAGLYDVQITDENDCKAMDSFQLSEPDSLIIRLDVPYGICFGDTSGSILNTVSGGSSPYTYTWSSGDNTKDLISADAGKYFCSVEDVNGCVVIDSAEIVEFAQIITSDIAGSQSVTVSGIETYSVNQTPGSVFNWEVTGGNITSGQQSNVVQIQWLGAGEGSVTVKETDERNCTGDPKSIAVTIRYPAGVSMNNRGRFSVYPNPAQEQFTIEAGDLSPCQIEFRSLNGKLILSTNMEESSKTISLSDCPRGIYFITLESMDLVATRKLVVF